MSLAGKLRKLGIETGGPAQNIMRQIAPPGIDYYVKPYTGLSTATGLAPNQALDSLVTAKTKVVADSYDRVVMIGEGNAAAKCSDYLTATLDWSKDLSSILGWGNGTLFSPRARVAFDPDYDTASNLFTLSANGCLVEGVQFYEGISGSDKPTGAVKVSGSRNVFRNVHFAGIGADENDIAGAYSLWLTGQENYFENCVIGLDTIDRGSAANQELLISAGAVRNYFKNCLFIMRLQHATNSPFVRIAGGAMGNPGPVAVFDNCLFLHSSTNYGYAQDLAIVFTATPTAGIVVVRNSTTTATAWGAASNNLKVQNSVSNTGYNQGILYSS